MMTSQLLNSFQKSVGSTVNKGFERHVGQLPKGIDWETKTPPLKRTYEAASQFPSFPPLKGELVRGQLPHRVVPTPNKIDPRNGGVESEAKHIGQIQQVRAGPSEGFSLRGFSSAAFT